MAPDYDGIATALTKYLKGVRALRFALGEGIETHISDEWEVPPVDKCPAVYIYPTGLPRTPVHLVGGVQTGSPYLGKYRFQLVVWAFSGQSTADASRQCRVILRALEQAIRGKPDLDRVVLFGEVTDVRLDFHDREGGGGLFARAFVDYEAQLLF